MGRTKVVLQAFRDADGTYHARRLPTAKISSSDVTRLINSDEIQSIVRAGGAPTQKSEHGVHTNSVIFLSPSLNTFSTNSLSAGPFTQKKNPLKNKAVLFRLNPYAKTLRRQELLRSEKKGSVKKSTPGKVAGAEFLKTLHAA